MKNIDVIIIGAGAAGLMCAIQAAKRGRSVLILEHENKPGKKILMSGGGRCNFTNYHIHPDCYISNNPAFCKSALSRFTQFDFIDLVIKHHISFHEKTLGQLFCDDKSQAILNMLLKECRENKVDIQLNINIKEITKINESYFKITTENHVYHSESLVIATGGLSIPTMGASPLGYQIATQFDIPVLPTRAGLVPLTLHEKDKDKMSQLSGIAIDSITHYAHIHFRENLLFTHRGLSGPAILQISSYWQPGEYIAINILPELDALSMLKHEKVNHPKKQLKAILSLYLPKRFIEIYFDFHLTEKKMADLSHQTLAAIASSLNQWSIKPNGTEGYRTAEVTLGGVDCHHISSKTMQAINTPGLFFIGEVLDVTGWLGGYNFQWAWSSGWAAGQAV